MVKTLQLYRMKVEIYKFVTVILYEVLYCTSLEYIKVTLFKLNTGIDICRNLSQSWT